MSWKLSDMGEKRRKNMEIDFYFDVIKTVLDKHREKNPDSNPFKYDSNYFLNICKELRLAEEKEQEAVIERAAYGTSTASKEKDKIVELIVAMLKKSKKMFKQNIWKKLQENYSNLSYQDVSFILDWMNKNDLAAPCEKIGKNSVWRLINCGKIQTE